MTTQTLFDLAPVAAAAVVAVASAAPALRSTPRATGTDNTPLGCAVCHQTLTAEEAQEVKAAGAAGRAGETRYLCHKCAKPGFRPK